MQVIWLDGSTHIYLQKSQMKVHVHIARTFRLYMDFDILTGPLPVKISKSIYSLNARANVHNDFNVHVYHERFVLIYPHVKH